MTLLLPLLLSPHAAISGDWTYQLCWDEPELFAKVQLIPASDTGLCSVEAHFFKGSPKGKATKIVALGFSGGPPRAICLADTLENGRTQLFVSIKASELRSYVLDFDGKSVWNVYESSDCWTWLQEDPKKGSYILECRKGKYRRVYPKEHKPIQQ